MSSNSFLLEIQEVHLGNLSVGCPLASALLFSYSTLQNDSDAAYANPTIPEKYPPLGWIWLGKINTTKLINYKFQCLFQVTGAAINGIIGIVSLSVIGISSLVAIGRYWQIRKKSSGTIKLRMFAINLYICLSTVVYITYQVNWKSYSRIVVQNTQIQPSPFCVHYQSGVTVFLLSFNWK